MSVWSSFSGTVRVHQCRHISINKLLSSSWDEVVVGINTIRQGEYFLHTIECRATVEGIYAHKWLDGIVKRLKELDKGCRIDFELNSRWVE